MEIDDLVRAVQGSQKYRAICEKLIRRIGTQELSKHSSFKEALKATKNKLHQIGGMYFEARVDYKRAIEELTEAATQGQQALKAASRRIMELHTSTKERNQILDRFYTTILASVPCPRTILDLACGLNPLAIPWMPFTADVVYYAYDIYTDLVDFIRSYLCLLGLRGAAEACDLTHSPPKIKADLALLLKTVPCLEQIEKGASLRLIESIQADYLLVSFPVHSIGGCSKGMIENYSERFYQLVQDHPWQLRQFKFATELVFLVTKTQDDTARRDRSSDQKLK